MIELLKLLGFAMFLVTIIAVFVFGVGERYRGSTIASLEQQLEAARALEADLSVDELADPRTREAAAQTRLCLERLIEELKSPLVVRKTGNCHRGELS